MILVVESGAELVEQAAARIAGLVRDAVAARGRCSLALAGGDTPRPVYERLARMGEAEVPWSRLHLYFGDERCVPPDDTDSNFRMVREALLDRAPIDAAQVHRMAGELDPEVAAQDYERELPDRLDVVLLGVGSDGHTASLFPGSPALATPHQGGRRVLAVTGSKPPPRRLTLSPRALDEARALLVLAAGADKAEAVAQALEGPWAPTTTPAQLARRGEWIVDRAAAAKLRSRQ